MGIVSVANPASSTMKQLDHLDRDEAGCGLFSFFCLRLFTQPQPAGQYISNSTQAPIDSTVDVILLVVNTSLDVYM